MTGSASWEKTDQFLVIALNSTISSSILPYVIHLDHYHQIWQTLETRLNSHTRQHIIQLKNDLHNIKKQDQSIQQYLNNIHIKVNSLAAVGSPPDPEDVILYVLNGLPHTYDAFAIAIRTRASSITVDELYALLSSEELILAAKEQTQSTPDPSTFALSRFRGRGRCHYPHSRRGRSRSRTYPQQDNWSSSNKSTRPLITYQICGKRGHSAINCWYRLDTSYSSSVPSPLLTKPCSPPPSLSPLTLTGSLTVELQAISPHKPHPYKTSPHTKAPIMFQFEMVLIFPSYTLATVSF